MVLKKPKALDMRIYEGEETLLSKERELLAHGYWKDYDPPSQTSHFDLKVMRLFQKKSLAGQIAF